MFSIITQYSTLKFSMDSVEIFSRAHIQETVKKKSLSFHWIQAYTFHDVSKVESSREDVFKGAIKKLILWSS